MDIHFECKNMTASVYCQLSQEDIYFDIAVFLTSLRFPYSLREIPDEEFKKYQEKNVNFKATKLMLLSFF